MHTHREEIGRQHARLKVLPLHVPFARAAVYFLKQYVKLLLVGEESWLLHALDNLLLPYLHEEFGNSRGTDEHESRAIVISDNLTLLLLHIVVTLVRCIKIRDVLPRILEPSDVRVRVQNVHSHLDDWLQYMCTLAHNLNIGLSPPAVGRANHLLIINQVKVDHMILSDVLFCPLENLLIESDDHDLGHTCPTQTDVPLLNPAAEAIISSAHYYAVVLLNFVNHTFLPVIVFGCNWQLQESP
mmetsp:Transcript_1353/g.2714  ORF Transcript_1353/g.2714 Transcript_1353/m.2714 type:complete len:242 (-) Transcript_1353:308-1033(-)